MYKVFVSGKPLFIVNDTGAPAGVGNARIERISTTEELERVLQVHAQSDEDSTVIVAPNPEDIWTGLQAKFKLVMAGGGVVADGSGRIVVIHRNGCWDLPKGKLDDGESIESCAVREVEEECGLKNVSLGSHLIDTYHTYQLGGQQILKRTVWYAMAAPEQELVAQSEEGITKVEWRAIDDMEDVKRDTYGSIRDVLDAYLLLQ